jgi:hypothetical protein
MISLHKTCSAPACVRNCSETVKLSFGCAGCTNVAPPSVLRLTMTVLRPDHHPR